MIIADYHTHTAFSDDSEATPRAMADQAVALGLKMLCITDHMDYLYPKKYAPTSFVFDPDIYFTELTALKEIYKDRLELLIGIELGLRNEPGTREACVEYYRKLCADYPFDFVIGSTHVLNGLDPYYPEYWETHSREAGMHAYFASILENTGTYDMFQIYGHLDYLVRYLPKESSENAFPSATQPASAFVPLDTGDRICGKDYCFSDYKELIAEILKKLIASGRGIELNTSGYKYGLPYAHPRTQILKLYRELHGEIITIGSDAHTPNHMAYDFLRAKDLLSSLGFSYYTIYRGRKAVFLPL